MGDDGIVLSDREREALAGLAESIGDPWLARQLAGQEDAGEPPSPAKPRCAGSILRRLNGAAASASAWVALVVVLAGAALTVVTFARSTPVASLGLLVMGAGLWRLAVDRADVIVRRVTERRVPAHAPPPPRTPPAAS